MNKYVLPSVIVSLILLTIVIAFVFLYNNSMNKESFGATFIAMSDFNYPVGIDPLPGEKINSLKEGNFLFSDKNGNIETISSKYFIDTFLKQTDINNLQTDRMNLIIDAMNTMKNEIAVVRSGGDNLQAELDTIKQNTNSSAITNIKNDIIDLNRKTTANETKINTINSAVDTIKSDYVKTSKPITLSGTTRIKGQKNTDHTIYRGFTPNNGGPVIRVGPKLTDLRPTELAAMRDNTRSVNDEKLWITQLQF